MQHKFILDLGIRRFSSKVINKVLIANRGEIACRVINTAKKLNIKTVAVYSEADKDSKHVSLADEAFCIGQAASQSSYLNMKKIVEVAHSCNAHAIHPGYGFLSENAEFAELLKKEGIVFIGPPAQAIRDMGSKSASKNIMSKAGVPVIPGYHGDNQDPEYLKQEAAKIGYPVLIKAVSGGGGKGMRIVEEESEFFEKLESAKRESLKSFNDDRVLVERYLTKPRHVEVQVFADELGNTVYLFERDCSVQRRHQKIIEEAPAPHLNEETRKKLGQCAVNAAKAVKYVGAGTVEFILNADNPEEFYFMEMNTRLQVEHPITEMITGQDLVEWQIKAARGEPLPLEQEQLKINGHAFEARIYAENPRNQFLPDSGTLNFLRTPEPGVDLRIESGVRQGDLVSVFYDPMIAKLVVHAENRGVALQKLHRALEAYKIVGMYTNVDFLKKLSSHQEFVLGHVETGFINKHKKDLLPEIEERLSKETIAQFAVLVALLENGRSNEQCNSPWEFLSGKRLNGYYKKEIRFKGARAIVTYKDSGYFDVLVQQDQDEAEYKGVKAKVENESEFICEITNELFKGQIISDADTLHLFNKNGHFKIDFDVPSFNASEGQQDLTDSQLYSPMPCKVSYINVKIGQAVKKGQTLLVVEAMKMEHNIKAPYDGVVEKINFKVGDMVDEKKRLITIKSKEQ